MDVYTQHVHTSGLMLLMSTSTYIMGMYIFMPWESQQNAYLTAGPTSTSRSPGSFGFLEPLTLTSGQWMARKWMAERMSLVRRSDSASLHEFTPAQQLEPEAGNPLAPLPPPRSLHTWGNKHFTHACYRPFNLIYIWCPPGEPLISLSLYFTWRVKLNLAGGSGG